MFLGGRNLANVRPEGLYLSYSVKSPFHSSQKCRLFSPLHQDRKYNRASIDKVEGLLEESVTGVGTLDGLTATGLV